MAELTGRLCWNCKDVAKFRFFCMDCWRMGAVTAMFFLTVASGGAELFHQLFPTLSLHGLLHLLVGSG